MQPRVSSKPVWINVCFVYGPDGHVTVPGWKMQSWNAVPGPGSGAQVPPISHAIGLPVSGHAVTFVVHVGCGTTGVSGEAAHEPPET